MPKILQNIDVKIYKEAKELFYNEGYRNVDMKIIAKKSGIAVGTLYNYYPNKKSIFLKILEESWNYTFRDLNSIEDSNKEVIFKKIISILYDDIKKRKGIGINLKKEVDNNDVDFMKMENYIVENLQNIIKNIINKDLINKYSKIIEKITYTILTNLYILIQVDGDNREENINFILEQYESFL
ncbi:TetR/AcrR family transcriptional regulator [Clostridium fallax]|uniref:Transcriptional regulator, TetR family n=2 Tax=Clostridium fallax TaxID=1533 RepID=A0A1M4VIH4_9CLOT|nr:TetR/AcrR family transcriptional regulator [Clostridium fallax]SHE68836.1 transcriptional regulator, TetR family [Clostridium fallax]SQB22744.1 TetR family transcriptional regulator [Clostridium fallax]